MSAGALSRVVAVLACGLAIAPGALAREGQVTATPPRPLEQASPAATPTGLILGQVVDATTNKPIARAMVALGGGAAQRTGMAGGPGPQRVLTDDDGHFLFRDLAKGAYTFTAVAPGYLSGGYGQRRPEGRMQPFALEDGQRAGDVVVRLWRESVIGGTVTDETGAPVTGVTVLINRRVTVNGRVELRPQQYGKRTNDRGVYSQAAIPPGDYVVTVPAGMTVTRAGQAAPDATATAALRASGADTLISGEAARSSGVRLGDFLVLPGGVNSLAGQLPLATLPTGRVVTYPTTFHPSATTLGAAGVIKLGVGEERTVDVQLQPVTTSPVSGDVVTADGPAVNYAVHLIPDFAAHTPVERQFETAVTITDQRGRFVFPAVAAGSYSVLTWRKPSRNSSLTNALPEEPALFAEAAVAVEDAPATVALTLRPGAMLRGRIVLEGKTPLPRPQAVPGRPRLVVPTAVAAGVQRRADRRDARDRRLGVHARGCAAGPLHAERPGQLLAARRLVPEVGDDRRPRPPQVAGGGRWPGRHWHRDHVHGSPGDRLGPRHGRGRSYGRGGRCAGLPARLSVVAGQRIASGGRPGDPGRADRRVHDCRPAARRVPAGRGRARDAG